MLVSQNSKTAAMLVSQTSTVGVTLFSYVKRFFFCRTMTTCNCLLQRNLKKLGQIF